MAKTTLRIRGSVTLDMDDVSYHNGSAPRLEAELTGGEGRSATGVRIILNSGRRIELPVRSDYAYPVYNFLRTQVDSIARMNSVVTLTIASDGTCRYHDITYKSSFELHFARFMEIGSDLSTDVKTLYS